MACTASENRKRWRRRDSVLRILIDLCSRRSHHGGCPARAVIDATNSPLDLHRPAELFEIAQAGLSANRPYGKSAVSWARNLPRCSKLRQWRTLPGQAPKLLDAEQLFGASGRFSVRRGSDPFSGSFDN